MKKMSSVDAACEVLKGERKGLHAKEIVRRVFDRQLVPRLRGKTPGATIRGRIADEAKKADGRVERLGAGLYVLKTLRMG